MITDTLKNIIVDNLVHSIHPQKIYLFGSYAYGEPNNDSDLDILVIKDDFDKKIEIKRAMRKALSGIDMSKDLLVVKSDEFEFYSHEAGSVYQTISQKGELLWSA
ncbi:MAG: nucleotidyltransferase domain-containing protein [Sulfurimonas sp.]|nr:nucleotidyltransferase domain-containing protein [Sulfurimonas sp.]